MKGDDESEGYFHPALPKLSPSPSPSPSPSFNKEHLALVLYDHGDASMYDAIEHARRPAISRESETEGVVHQLIMVTARMKLDGDTLLPTEHVGKQVGRQASR